MLKQFYQIILGVAFLSFGLFSCAGESDATQEKVTTSPTVTTAPSATINTNTTVAKDNKVVDQPITDAEVKIDWNASEFLIQESGLAGIFAGQPLSTASDRIKKELLKNGEGEFVAYYFTTKAGQPLGYFVLDRENEALIGDVTVTSPEAATKDGIKVGSTYAELQTVAPGLIVHGSEIESRTHAYKGRIAYLLEAAFNTYEVDENQIKPDTQIKEIRLMRNPTKR